MELFSVTEICLLFLAWMPFSSGQFNYSIYTEETDWKSASTKCSLATPRIDFTANVNYSVDFYDSSLQLEVGKKYWIGYQKSKKTYKYEGCSAVPVGQSYNYLLKAIPGLCFSACHLLKSTYFGLRLNSTDISECFCLTDKPSDLLGTGCNRNCIHKPLEYPLVSCGGLEHISVYSIVLEMAIPYVKNHPIPGFVGHCITYQNVDQHSYEWFWTGCTRALHPLCESVHTGVDNLRQLNTIVDENRNWFKSVEYCLDHGMLPADMSYSDRLLYHPDSVEVDSPSWTAFFRDMFVYIPDKDELVSNPMVTDAKCAYISMEKDKIPRLDFRSCLATEKMNFICQAGKTLSTTSRPSTEEMNSRSSSARSEQTPLSTTPAVTQHAPQKGEEISLIVPIIVGVVCGLLVLIAIIIVIVCCRKRSKRKQEEAEKKGIPELENYTHQITNMDYAVVDKFRKEDEKRNASENYHRPNGEVADYSNTLNDDNANYYDHTDSNRGIPHTGKTENIYNKLNSQDGAEQYDISGLNKKPDLKQSDELYNELETHNTAETYDRTDDGRANESEIKDPYYDRAEFCNNDETHSNTNKTEIGVKESDAVYSQVKK